MIIPVLERRNKPVLKLKIPLPFPSYPALNSSSLVTSSRVSPDINSISDLEKLEVIGWGSGGTVYKVMHKLTGHIYALKVVRFDDDGDSVAREAEILQRVGSSEYVVRCIGVGDSSGELSLVMEYMSYGSLLDIIRRKKRLPESIISGVVRSVLKGLKYLHGLHVVHGDIKPSNLLINVRGEVKIADFGASRVGVGISCADGEVACMGTFGYMSPERWDGEECDGFAGDVWSLGIVAMECYVGRFPLIEPGQKLDWATLMWTVWPVDMMVESVLKMGSPEFRSFCRRCLVRDWKNRGTVDELLLHPFIRQNQHVGPHNLMLFT